MGEAEIAGGLLRAATETLRPLVRRLLAAGVPFGQLESRLRRLYVEVADRELAAPGRRQTVSRVAALTGINRKEVRRLRTEPAGEAVAPAAFGRSLAASLVSRWIQDPDAASRGRPRVIPYQAARGPSFVKLARATTVDLPARALLEALVANGVAEVRSDGRVALTSAAYVPRRGRPESMAMLSEDPRDLVATMLRNVLDDGAEPFLQCRIAYDRIGADALPRLRSDVRRASASFVRRIDRLLARFDQDRSPRAPGGARRRAGLGLYWFEDTLPPSSPGSAPAGRAVTAKSPGGRRRIASEKGNR